MLTDNSRQLGGWCAILAGLVYIVWIPSLVAIGVNENQPDPPDGGAFLSLLAANPTPWLLVAIEAGLAAIFALGVIATFSELARDERNDGWIRFSSALAYVGATLSAISAWRTASLAPAQAAAYVTGDVSTRAAIAAQYTPIGLSSFDPWGFFWSAGLGLWILVVSLAARRRALLPGWVAAVGIADGVFQFLHFVGEVARLNLLIGIGGGFAQILTIVWLVAAGVVLVRRETALAIANAS